ncbi:ABC transporter permease [Metabacillus halosaccharovorans]|uniref:ABC transporter permease n=1 Tax=Metabacillus halosaccharovorans TaxID=930124 RepID=UPI001C1F873B|nr:iron ABC transporter permease [Metabacillus halosaccharovorans]MBU7594512.1 iron ABC transporter permease [Metabacillus halosaccharovorans]
MLQRFIHRVQHKNKWWFLIGVLFVVIFFVLPIFRLVFLSFSSEGGFTFENYTSVLQDRSTWKTIENTLYVVVGSSIIAIILGIMTAWVVAYTNIRQKKLIQLFIFLPFIIPSYITTLAWTQFMSKNGFFANLLSLLPGSLEPLNMYSLQGIIIVMGLSHYPLVYLLTVGVLRKIPRDLEYAARVSGSSKWQSFKKITLPLALPGIASGGFLAFIASLDNFGIPAFLGIPGNIRVLSTYIYEQIVGLGPNSFERAATLSVILGLIALTGTFIQWLLLKKSKNNETAVEDKEPRFLFSKRKRLTIELLLWSFLLLTTMVPLISMLSASLIKAYGLQFAPENISLKNYQFVLLENQKAITSLKNSANLAIITTIFCLVAGTGIAYIRTKRPSIMSKGLEMIIGIPYALPGTVLALAMIFAWMEPIPGWNPGIYGTIMILLIAYVTRFLILQVRGSITAFMQVDPSIEEAARVSGSNGFYKWKQILLPLIIPGVISGALLVFLTALTELTVSSLLWSSGTETIGLVIFNFEQAGYSTYSTAFSCIVVLIILLAFFVLSILQKLWDRRVLHHDHSN